MRTLFSRAVTAWVAVSLLLSPWFSGVLVAAPTTPEIEAKQSELSVALTELDRLADELSLQVEEYNAISEALDKTRGEIAVTESDLVRAKQDVAVAEGILRERAEDMYRAGPTEMLQVVLGTRSFQDFIVRLDFVRRISSQDARVVDEVREARDLVEELKHSLEIREAEQRVLRDEAASAKSRIERSIASQEEYASSLDGEVRRLIAEEEERQRLLAEERARQAEEAAKRAAEAARRAEEEAGEPRDFPGSDSSAGPGRAEVVQIGLRYLGIPYAWAGSDPAIGFDCSGLTQYVYAQVGIFLPRTSRSQSHSGTHIDADRLDLLELGDLVFFGYDGDPDRVHHVGIYVGDGNYLHAPQTGDVVRVSSLADRIAQKGDYVGASRF